MRIQVTVVSGTAWEDLCHDENLARVREMEAYGARVKVVTLPMHIDTLTPDSPFRERRSDEQSVVIEITLEALAEYCSANDLVATLVPQDRWDRVNEGADITHHLFLSEADRS